MDPLKTTRKAARFWGRAEYLYLGSGSDAVILRHPEAVKTIAKMIDALM